MTSTVISDSPSPPDSLVAWPRSVAHLPPSTSHRPPCGHPSRQRAAQSMGPLAGRFSANHVLDRWQGAAFDGDYSEGVMRYPSIVDPSRIPICKDFIGLWSRGCRTVRSGNGETNGILRRRKSLDARNICTTKCCGSHYCLTGFRRFGSQIPKSHDSYTSV
jgi:hypothetical protein